MGIKDLSKVLGDHAASAIRTNEMKAYFGRKIAIDASMSLYQFLIAVRQDGAQLMDDNGETTRCVHFISDKLSYQHIQTSYIHALFWVLEV